MKTKAKMVSARLKLVSDRGARGRDCFMKVVIKLARYMRYRLRRLTSRKVHKQMMTRNLDIKFEQRAYPKVAKRSKLLTKVKVPMDIDKELEPFLHFWHEPTWSMFLLRIAEACSNVGSKTLKRTTHVIMEAKGFIRCHIKKTEVKYDGKYLEEVMSEMNSICGEKFDPYLPVSEDQLAILTGKSTLLRKQQICQSTTDNLIDEAHNAQLKHEAVKRNWRQTKIDEYFKPSRIKMGCYGDNN